MELMENFTMSIEITYLEEIKRKAVHLSSLWMVAATLLFPYFFPEYGRWISCIVFAALLVLTLVSEHDYANNGPYLGKLYGILFGKMLRKEVKPGMWIVSGGSFVLAAALLVNLLFEPYIAAPSLAVMLTADAAAALIGRKFGRHKAPNGKSWEGVAAFIQVGYGALAAVLAIAGAPAGFFVAAIPAVILAAAVELFEKQLRLDDNFSIPLCIGAVLFAASFLPCMQESRAEKFQRQIKENSTAAESAADKISDAADSAVDDVSKSIKKGWKNLTD